MEWHEWKTGVAYRHDHAGQTAERHGRLAHNVVVSWQASRWNWADGCTGRACVLIEARANGYWDELWQTN